MGVGIPGCAAVIGLANDPVGAGPYKVGTWKAGAQLSVVKNDVTTAISKSHGLNVADLVLVGPGSIPTTTSGKIRRAACVDQYRDQQFARLDA